MEKADSDASDRVRGRLSETIEAQLVALTSVAPTNKTIRNTPVGQGDAAVLKTLAETAKLTFGWGNDSNLFVYGLNSLSGAQAQVTDVANEVIATPVQSIVDTPKTPE